MAMMLLLVTSFIVMIFFTVTRIIDTRRITERSKYMIEEGEYDVIIVFVPLL